MAAIGSIFTDGACSGNGTARAVGGWAWAYWPGPARGEPAAAGAEALTRPPHATNQRAELTALLEGMRWARARGLGRTAVTFYSDSQYAIKCASVWGPAWKRKGWRRESGEPLQNLDIIQPLVELWTAADGRWPLVHVRGHRTGSSPEVWGNNWVDRAAVSAAEGIPIHLVGRVSVPPASDIIEHVAPIPAPASVPPKPAGGAGAGAGAGARASVRPTGPPRQTDLRLWFAAPEA